MSKYVPNSFQVANAFVDEAMSKISDASVKIYLIINRKTRGWAKECDALSITQLEELSGKSHPTVVRCTKELVKVGLVKKHEQSVYGNVYSLIDNYFVGEYINFPNKSSVLVQTFCLFNGQLVKNFNYQKAAPKKSTKGKKSKNLCLNFPQKSRLLVKNFNYLQNTSQLKNLTTASKNFLPLLVKIFNTQNTLSKPTYQNKKNTWFILENLKFEISSINPSIDTNEIFKASWFERELKAFNGFNEGRNHSDFEMVKFFAEWMLKARAKYAKMKTPAPRSFENKNSSGQQSISENTLPEVITFASDKQLFTFARLLVNHPDFKDSFCRTGESWMDAGKRMAQKLIDPQEQKPFIPYLLEMGFKCPTKETAA
ncbi:replication protein [Acinetobacter sp. AOR18_HL]|uniref:replication protein n=1 Tax=Acinetobacter sp. AOR18_HL TaxID=2919381 RepID=UPI0022EAD0AF|nr:replication protein [Acinetobacter sp. AOR18_HL]MDA3542507.1 replication protein [Acinetobacter sp. AOR18_HL]